MATILNRCGYNWEDGVPFIPCLDGQNQRQYFINRRRGVKKADLEKRPEVSPKHSEMIPKPKLEPNSIFDKRMALIDFLNSVKRMREVRGPVAEFLGCTPRSFV